MRTHVVILGAGFGGLELSTRLSEELAEEKSHAFRSAYSRCQASSGRPVSSSTIRIQASISSRCAAYLHQPYLLLMLGFTIPNASSEGMLCNGAIAHHPAGTGTSRRVEVS
jgi:hypothetical protein